MPRPAVKRNRHAKAAALANETLKTNDTPGGDISQLKDADEELLNEKIDASHRAGDKEAGQRVNNQTPTMKQRSHTADPTPGGDRTASHSRPPTRTRGYSSTLSLGGRRADMNAKVPGTPAFENSVLSNFRRRPRQPSILQMTHMGENLLDSGDDDDFLGGLSPDAESTPLNFAQRASRQDPVSLAESPLSTSPDRSRKRKRISEELQMPGSPLVVIESTQLHSPSPASRDGTHFGPTSSPSLPENIGILSQTMAMPESSSPAPSPACAAFPLDDSHAASEPSEQTMDVHYRTVRLSTKTLQNKVLPRRRLPQRKPRDACDFVAPADDDDGDSGGDELNCIHARASRMQRKRVHRSSTPAESGPKSKYSSRKGGKNGTGVTSQDTAAAKEPSLRRTRRTFGKENRLDNLNSEPVAELQKSLISKELKLQAQKFAEIDKWEMEFEDVTASVSQTSSTL